MADKDKRIRIMEMINPCKVCKLKRTCKRKCIFYLMLMKDSISKADAIKCMAEAMFCASGLPKILKRKAINALYKDYAEKALNALLGDK